jgi:hypothetical protein
MPIDAAFAHVATFRGAQIARWRAYARREEALEAEGLRDSSPRPFSR